MKKFPTSTPKADFEKTEDLTGDTLVTPADVYQKTFVNYVNKPLPTGTDTLANLKFITDIATANGDNAVICGRKNLTDFILEIAATS